MGIGGWKLLFSFWYGIGLPETVPRKKPVKRALKIESYAYYLLLVIVLLKFVIFRHHIDDFTAAMEYFASILL